MYWDWSRRSLIDWYYLLWEPDSFWIQLSSYNSISQLEVPTFSVENFPESDMHTLIFSLRTSNPKGNLRIIRANSQCGRPKQRERQHWRHDSRNWVGPRRQARITNQLKQATAPGCQTRSYRFIVWRLVVVNWLNRYSCDWVLDFQVGWKTLFFNLLKSKQQSLRSLP